MRDTAIQLALPLPEPREAAVAEAPLAPRIAPPDRGPRDTAILRERLDRLGLPPVPRFETHRNRQVMLSWLPDRYLRVHRAYVHAPDPVLRAIVRFVTPGTRRETRAAARRLFLSFPVEDYGTPRAPRRPAPPAPGDQRTLGELARLHQEYNARWFAGQLSEIPLRLSGRMRTRLGEVRLERRTGRALEIGISRRHLRRDGWESVRETLLHEMIHQWQAETGRAVDHGAEFRRKAREIGISPRAVRVD